MAKENRDPLLKYTNLAQELELMNMDVNTMLKED